MSLARHFPARDKLAHDYRSVGSHYKFRPRQCHMQNALKCGKCGHRFPSVDELSFHFATACRRRVCEFVFLFLVVCIFRLLTCFACSVSKTTPSLSGLLVLFHARQHLVRTNKSAIIGKVALHVLCPLRCVLVVREEERKKACATRAICHV